MQVAFFLFQVNTPEKSCRKKFKTDGTNQKVAVPKKKTSSVGNGLSNGDICMAINKFYSNNMVPDNIFIFDPVLARQLKDGLDENLKSLGLEKWRYIFIPVEGAEAEENKENIPNVSSSFNSWGLLRFDTESREFVYVASMKPDLHGGNNEMEARLLSNNLVRILEIKEHTFQTFRVIRDVDCGVLILAYIHSFLLNERYDNPTLEYSIKSVLRNYLGCPGKHSVRFSIY